MTLFTRPAVISHTYGKVTVTHFIYTSLHTHKHPFLPREATRSAVLPWQVVRPSVTLRYHDHIGSNSWKIISRLISQHFALCRPQHDGSAPKGTPPNFCRNRSGVGKSVDFRHVSRRISETVQDRVQVAIDH